MSFAYHVVNITHVVSKSHNKLKIVVSPQWPKGLASLTFNHSLSHLWVQLQQVALFRTCHNMTQAVEWDVKHQF